MLLEIQDGGVAYPGEVLVVIADPKLRNKVAAEIAARTGLPHEDLRNHMCRCPWPRIIDLIPQEDANALAQRGEVRVETTEFDGLATFFGAEIAEKITGTTVSQWFGFVTS